MWRQGRAAPVQQTLQRVRPWKGGRRRGFRIGCVGHAGCLGADASPSPQDGKTPLQLALEEGNEEVAKMLREAGSVEERIAKVTVLATRPL